jgi:hypothetical protein
MLIAKNLNKGFTLEQVEQGLITLIGDRNIYFPRAEADMLVGIANIKFLNAPIYKKFVKKTHKLQSEYIIFNPHLRSLDDSTAPFEEIERSWGSRM